MGRLSFKVWDPLTGPKGAACWHTPWHWITSLSWMNNSSPVGWPHSRKCMPVSCRLWVYGSYIHIDAQFMFTQHEAYWIQDTPVEVSTKGRQVHQRAIGLLTPCFPIRPCACRRTWKTSFEVTGWWLTICGSHNPGTKRYTSSSKHERGTKSPF